MLTPVMTRCVWLLALLPAAAHAQKWVRLESREGRFSAQFPAAPRQSTVTTGPLTTHLFKLDGSTGYTGTASFLVTYTDYTAEQASDRGISRGGGLLATFRAQLVRTYQAKLVEDAAGVLDGFPAHDLAFETTQGLAIRIKLCLANNRLFQAVTTAPARPASGIVTRFLTSFHVNDGPPPAEGWERVTTIDDVFTLWVPGRQTPLAARTLDTPHGPLALREVRAGRGYLNFAAAFADYPESFPAAPSPAQMLPPVTEALVTASGGKVVREQSLPYSGNPGREVAVETPKGFLQLRICVIRKRVYIFSVSGRAEDQAAPEIATFFKAIRMAGE